MRRKLIKQFLIFVFIFAISLPLLALKSHSADSKSFLWKIQSRTGTVYLLGSIHFFKKELYPLNKSIMDAYNESDSLVVEVNINKVDPAAIQKSMFEGSMYAEDGSLRNNLSRETYEQAKAKLSEYGLPIRQLDMFKPSFIAITLTALEVQRQGFDPAFGIDRHFINKAIQDNKEILELETFDLQIDLFKSFSDKEQELFLIYTLMDMNIIGSQIEILVDSWFHGDTKTMESILTKSVSDRPELYPVYDILIDKRNKEMATKIEQFLSANNRYFVVVGAAHLIGDNGIIKLLKKRGFIVEQL